MTKIISAALCVLAVFAAVFPTGSVLLEPTPLVNPQQVSVGRDASGQEFFCVASLGFDGRYSILREDTGQVLLREDELGAQRLAHQGVVTYRCNWVGVVFFSHDPNRTQGGRPVVSLMLKTWAGQLVTLVGPDRTFMAPDPRNGGQNTVFSYVQAFGFDVRGDRAYIIAAGQPPPIPGTTIPQGLQTFVLEFVGTNTSPRVIFNNLVGVDKFQLASLSAFCATNGGFYIAGADPNMKSGQGVFRIVNGLVQQVKGESVLSGSIIECGDFGLQTFSASPNGVVTYTYVPDSGPERMLFSGSLVGDVVLGSADRQYLVDPDTVYVATRTGALVRVAAGKAQVLKLPSQQPTGSAVAVAIAAGKKLLLQTEGSFPFSPTQNLPLNRSYWLYEPAIHTPVAAGRPGDTVKYTGADLSVGGSRPSLSLQIGGRDVQWRSSFDGNTIEVLIPANAPFGRYEGAVDVQGIKIPVTLHVQSEAQSLPTVTAVVRGASFAPAPVSPRMHITVFYSGATGARAQAGAAAAYELGGVSAELDGVPVRLVFNDGNGQLNAVLPNTPAGKVFGQLVVKVGGVSSLPYPVAIVSRADELFMFVENGVPLPILTDPAGNLITGANRVAANGVVVGYGTGCGSGNLPDNANTPGTGVAVSRPAVRINGQAAEVQYAGLVAGFVGLCQYNIKLPASLQPGSASMQFGDSGQTYTLLVR